MSEPSRNSPRINQDEVTIASYRQQLIQADGGKNKFEVGNPKPFQSLASVEPNSEKMGLLLTFLSAFFITLMTLIVKILDDINPMQVLFLRSFPIGVAATAYLYYTKKQDQIREACNQRMIAVGLTGFSSSLFYFVSLGSLSLSEAIIIMFSSAIFNGILAKIFLGEPYEYIEKVTGATCFLGVILIVRPPFLFKDEGAVVYNKDSSTIYYYAGHFVAALVCTFSAFLVSSCQVLIRSTKTKWHPLLPGIYINAITFIVLAVYYMLFGSLQKMSFVQVVGVLLVAAANLAANACTTKALQILKPAVVGIIKYSEMVFTILFDLVFLGVIPKFYTIIGAALLVGSCIILIRSKK